MHAATVQIVSEVGYDGLTVARIIDRARLSRRTFYELFEDREDCFLAVFDRGVEEIATVVVPAYRREGQWRAAVRAGLTALLECLDADPQAAALCVVHALGAGPRALAHRARVLDGLREALDRGRASGKRGRELAPHTAEGLVGAVFGVIHARLCEPERGPLTDLAGSLMAMIVLPYLGPAAAADELARSAPRKRTDRRAVTLESPLEGLDMRLTYRTLRVLCTIAQQPGASNREVGEGSEVIDQGQISKLLARLERLGLVHNTGFGHALGKQNAWQLTARGTRVVAAIESGQGSNGSLS